MVFDYGAMGDARKSGDLIAQTSTTQRKEHDPQRSGANFRSLRDMYDKMAISFESMEYVRKLGGATLYVSPVQLSVDWVTRHSSTGRARHGHGFWLLVRR